MISVLEETEKLSKEVWRKTKMTKNRSFQRRTTPCGEQCSVAEVDLLEWRQETGAAPTVAKPVSV